MARTRMTFVAFIFILLTMLVGGCGGGATSVGDSDTQPGVTGHKPLGGLPAELKALSADPDLTQQLGSFYRDTDLDVYQKEWRNWDLVFDYGDPDPGLDYSWGKVELVEVDPPVDLRYPVDHPLYDLPLGWYAVFTFDMAPLDAPAGSAAGYDEYGPFYGFDNVAVHATTDAMPTQAGKFDFRWDLTIGGVLPESAYPFVSAKVYLPLYDGGRDGNVDFDGDNMSAFKIAIHATVCYIDYVEYDTGLDNPDGTPIMDWHHVYVGDDTGWSGLWRTFKGCEGHEIWDHLWGKGKWGGFMDSYIHTPPVFTPDASRDYTNVISWYTGPAPANTAYWRFSLSPDGSIAYPYPFPPYDQPKGGWFGWCVDPTNWTGSPHIILYSCYDPALVGSKAESKHWDSISWILNEINKPATDGKWYHRGSANFHWAKVQRALWALKYGLVGLYKTETPSNVGVPYSESNADVKLLIDDALDYGDNYFPGPGEYYAVVCYPANAAGARADIATQMNIIEVDP